MGSSLLTLVIAAILFLAMRRQRTITILSGVLLLPFFPLAILFNGHYWQPVRYGGGALGVEDALFTFLSAALAWAIAIWPWHSSARFELRITRLLVRVLSVHALAFLMFLMIRLFGPGVVPAYLASHLLLIAVLLWLRPSYWRLAWVGCVSYSVVYILALQLYFSLWAGFRSAWTAPDVWGVYYCGMPLGDIMWAALFGGSWPLLVAFACEVRLRPLSVPADEPCQ